MSKLHASKKQKLLPTETEPKIPNEQPRDSNLVSILDLPMDVLKQILGYMNPTQLNATAKVCQLWKNVATYLIRDRCRVLLTRAVEDAKSARDKDEKGNGRNNTCEGGEATNNVEECDAQQLARDVEQEMYQLFAGDVSRSYSIKLRMLTANIKNTKNKEFRNSLLTQQIHPYDLVRMSSQSMAGYELTRQREEWLHQHMQRAIVDTTATHLVGRDSARQITTQFCCPECGNKEAAYYHWRTTDDIEHGTVFLFCTKCLHRWEG